MQTCVAFVWAKAKLVLLTQLGSSGRVKSLTSSWREYSSMISSVESVEPPSTTMHSKPRSRRCGDARWGVGAHRAAGLVEDECLAIRYASKQRRVRRIAPVIGDPGARRGE